MMFASAIIQDGIVVCIFLFGSLPLDDILAVVKRSSILRLVDRVLLPGFVTGF